MSECSCGACRSACTYRPGMFAPGEAERAAALLAPNPTPAPKPKPQKEESKVKPTYLSDPVRGEAFAYDFMMFMMTHWPKKNLARFTVPLYSADAIATADVEAISAEVHVSWVETKRAAGVTSRKLESGEEPMVDYAQLSEQAKDLDRGTVRTVLAALQRVMTGTPTSKSLLTPHRGPLVHIAADSRRRKPPCGECHMKPGETCDVCGAREEAR